MTNQAIQRLVDKLAQAAIDRMRIAHARRCAELQAQIEECQRQQELCMVACRRLVELA